MSLELSTADLRGNDLEELGRTLQKLREELFQMRMKRATNQLENTSTIRKTRRDIARVLTIMNEKVSGESPSEASAEE